MEARQVRAYRMLEDGLEPEQFRYGLYFIPSQSGKNRYLVNAKGDFWTCECPDFMSRHKVCKHIHMLKLWLSLRKTIARKDAFENEPEAMPVIACSFCGSRKVSKNGTRKNMSIPKQRYICNKCGKSFIADKDFRKVKGNPKIITMAMDLWFKGISLRKIQDHIYQFYGFKVHYSTIQRWIKKFMEAMNKYVSKYKPEVSNTWHADEMMIKSKGRHVWLWNVLDSETRFLLSNSVTERRFTKDAREVFAKAKETAKSKPHTMVTDGLHAYERAVKKEFRTNSFRPEHKRLVKFRDKINNNIVERFNGTVRERDKVMRGHKGDLHAQAMMEAYKTYYNFVRKHQALGRTPSEEANIDLKMGNNRWLSLLRKSLNNNNENK